MKKKVSPRSINRDDDKLLLNSEETLSSLNIEVDSSLQSQDGLVRSASGNSPVPFSDESMILPQGINSVIGSVSDDQLGVIYYFVHNSNNEHFIAAYSSKKKTYRIVFKDSSLAFPENGFVKADVLRLRRVPEDLEAIINVPEPEEPPVVYESVKMNFDLAVDMSIEAENKGFSSSSIGVGEYTAKLRFQSSGFFVGQSKADLLNQNYQLDFDCLIRENIHGGWVAQAVEDVHFSASIWEEPDATLSYSFVQTLNSESDISTEVYVDEILSSEDQYSITNYSTPSDLSESEDIRLFGKSVSIKDATIEFLTGDTEVDIINASISSTGYVKDRFTTALVELDMSLTEEWNAFFLSQQYNDGEFTAGRFDEGDPGAGFGGGDDDDISGTVYIYYCPGTEIESYQGFDVFPSQSEALAQWSFLVGNGIPSNTIQVLELPNCISDIYQSSFDGTPYVKVIDFKNGDTQIIPSSTQYVYDPSGPFLTSKFKFSIPSRLSSCGTMRTKNGFYFSINSNTEIDNEVLDESPVSGSFMWSKKTENKKISDEVTIENYGEVLVAYRTFEVSAKDPDGEFFTDISGYQSDTCFMSYDSGDYISDVVPYCFESLSNCGVEGRIVSTPALIEVNVEQIEDPQIDINEDNSSEGGESSSTETKEESVRRKITESKRNIKLGK